MAKENNLEEELENRLVYLNGMLKIHKMNKDLKAINEVRQEMVDIFEVALEHKEWNINTRQRVLMKLFIKQYKTEKRMKKTVNNLRKRFGKKRK